MAAGCSLLACDAIFGIQKFPDDETDAGGDAATTDVGADAATPEAAKEASAGASCVDAGSCPASSPACSQGRCTAISSLVPGTSNEQCVILADGTLWCWGYNGAGELGRGAVGGQYFTPAPVSVLPAGSVVAQAGTGVGFACALTANDHVVRCWGTAQAGGGFGPAVKVALPSDAVELSVSSIAACARVTGNAVYCWGDDTNSNIGCGAGDAGAIPVSPLAPQLLFDSSMNIVRVAAGLLATCGVPAGSGMVLCSGNGQWGTLGAGSTSGNCSSALLSNVSTNGLGSIIAADFATCVSDDNGEKYCWGMNYVWYGVGLLDPTKDTQDFDTPYLMPLPQTAGLTIGWLHGCSLYQAGDVYCWGGSTHGETGIYSSSAVPLRKIAGLGTVTQITAQRQFTCALQSDGQVLCWGNNQFDTIGPSIGTDTPKPTAIVW
jgi:alpha-tubulin suppressor-like RCC1 family protein